MTIDPKVLTVEQRAALNKRLKTDFWFYAKHTPLKIEDKATLALVPLSANPAQLYVWRKLHEMAKRGRPVRALIPKSRQLGMTTAFVAEKYWLAATRKRQQVYMLLQDLDPAAEVYRKLDTMHTHQQAMFRPSLREWSTGRKMVFAETESTIQVHSVKKRGAGRSQTLHHVHMTEIPWWDDPRNTIVGIEQSVPMLDAWRTSIILESTCFGVGDYWYWMVQRALKERGMYTLIFLPWFIEKEYERGLLHPKELKNEPLTTDETLLGKRIQAECPKYGVAKPSWDDVVRKLLWRRTKIDSIGYDQFCQEYPVDVDEAFLASGRPVFPQAAVRAHRNRVNDAGDRVISDPALVMRVKETAQRFDADAGKVRRVYDWVQDWEGPLKLWELPKDGAQYVLGGDTASGEAHDKSAIQIVKVADPSWRTPEQQRQIEQVGVWHGDIGGREYAYVMAFLSKKFNGALMAPENNGTGAIVLETLNHDIRFQGMRLYQYEQRDQEDGKLIAKYGFNTNVNTRPALIEVLYDLIRDPLMSLIIRHDETLVELAQFAFNKKGKPEHPEGGFDDLLFALMIACYVRRNAIRSKIEVINKPSFDYSGYDLDGGVVDLGVRA